MLPYKKRIPDRQYQNVLKTIIEEGEIQQQTFQGPKAMFVFGELSMKFNLRNGVPLITERNINFWRAAIGEIFAFVNGARTQADLEKFGCHWWKDWVTSKKCGDFNLPPGDLGPGSYGAAFHDFPTLNGPFNQFKSLIAQMKKTPFARYHTITPWIPQYCLSGDRQVVVAPCHGWMFFKITDQRLDLAMVQRSADVPIGVPANLIQYSALLMALAQVLNLEPGWFKHILIDAHFYLDQFPAVNEILNRTPQCFPTMTINPNITELFDFRAEHFKISDYYPHPAIPNIPVGI